MWRTSAGPPMPISSAIAFWLRPGGSAARAWDSTIQVVRLDPWSARCWSNQARTVLAVVDSCRPMDASIACSRRRRASASDRVARVVGRFNGRSAGSVVERVVMGVGHVIGGAVAAIRSCQNH